jgi:hypothetical protein
MGYLKSTLEFPGLRAGTCFRPERSTEVTSKSQAKGLGAVEWVKLNIFFLPSAFKGFFLFSHIPK